MLLEAPQGRDLWSSGACEVFGRSAAELGEGLGGPAQRMVEPPEEGESWFWATRWRKEHRWAANALYEKFSEAMRSWYPAWDLVESVASRCPMSVHRRRRLRGWGYRANESDYLRLPRAV